ncbi:MAG: hypothetical protein HYT03_00865 [Candidatus Harrisonbacteria bacterium]|nr:hypothetical protein [Candidatus Harrisonbacteria bacterium]
MPALINFLETSHSIILIIHTVGFILGVGGATVNDFLFFKFLKDLKISHLESSILASLSKIIWAGLIVLIISGVGLFLPDSERLLGSPKFLAKMVVVLIILINGIALNLWISPKLKRISFEKKHEHVPGELRNLRRFAFALGAISIISWYSALILGSLRRLPYSFMTFISVYLLLILIGVVGSLAFEYLISKRKIKP